MPSRCASTTATLFVILLASICCCDAKGGFIHEWDIFPPGYGTSDNGYRPAVSDATLCRVRVASEIIARHYGDPLSEDPDDMDGDGIGDACDGCPRIHTTGRHCQDNGYACCGDEASPLMSFNMMTIDDAQMYIMTKPIFRDKVSVKVKTWFLPVLAYAIICASGVLFLVRFA